MHSLIKSEALAFLLLCHFRMLLMSYKYEYTVVKEIVMNIVIFMYFPKIYAVIRNSEAHCY